MIKLRFALLWGVSWCVGRMPIKLQFLLGDFIYLLLYRVIGYRKKVVRENLKNSFPEKSDAERHEIEHKFYKHLADVFVESVALSSMSREELTKRMKYVNYEIMDSDRPSICAMAHYGSWEYTINFNAFVEPRPVLAVYHPLTDKAADMFFVKMRSRFGTRPVPMAQTSKEMLKEIRNGNKPVVALIADQTPPHFQIRKWINFLNQPTAFFGGMEKLAIKLKTEVLFGYVINDSRGHYSCHFEKLYDGKESIKEGEITERYAVCLERLIKSNPSQWMWSHRRWKHKPQN